MASSAVLFSRAGAVGGGGAPSVVSIVIPDASPLTVQITYSDSLDVGSVPATSRFGVLGDGVTKGCTNVSIGGTGNKVVTLTFNFSFYFEESVLLYYFAPAVNPLRAAGGGSAVADILYGAATNNIAATGTVYYVDPATGSDANAGTSQGSPWKTIPGMRNTAGSAFVSATYGGSSAALAAGSRVRIKAGSTFTSAEGGRLLINSTWWSQGTAKNPCVIQVADDWGTGNVTYDCTGMTAASDTPALWVSSRSYIHIRGTSAARLVVRDWSSSNGWGVAFYSSADSGAHRTGCQLAYTTVQDCTCPYGIDWGFTDSFVCRDCIVHDLNTTASVGIGCGMIGDQQTDGGEFRDCESYNIAVSASGQPLAHCYLHVGCINTMYRRCKAHDAFRDGFDFGSTANNNTTTATYIDCDTYDNGEDGFGCNGGEIGSGQTYIAIFINCRAFRNGNGCQPYDGVDARFYHCTFYGNTGRQFFPYSFTDAYGFTNLVYRNNYLGRCSVQVQVYPGGTKSPEATIDSDYNAWIATTALTDNDFEEMPNPNTVANYNNWTEFGANETVAGGYRTTTQQAFVNAAGGDFNLADNTGTAANRGTALAGLPALCERDGSSTKTTLGRLRNATTPDLGAYEYAA